MQENKGVIRTWRWKLSRERLAQIENALKDGGKYTSYENSALAAIIWLLFVFICGAGAGAFNTEWNEFIAELKAFNLNQLFGDQIGGTGLVVSLIGIVLVLRYWFVIHKRFGYVLLPDAIGRIRGNRVTLLPFENIKSAYSSKVTAGNDPQDGGYGERHFDVLKLTMLDGSHFTLYKPGLNLSAIKDRITYEKDTVRNKEDKVPFKKEKTIYNENQITHEDDNSTYD